MIKPLLCLGICFCTKLMPAQTDSVALKTTGLDSTISNFMIPVFNTTGADAESALGQQDISSLLQSSRDVFTQFASFQFGAAHYRMRGYASQNQLIMINGINVADPGTGSASWSSWGGLNDVSRFVETNIGNGSNRYGFSGAGGYSNIDSKASSFKKGTRVSYANANKIFSNRFMLTHSTGMLWNGWAFTFSISNRYGNQVYVSGTYFNASSFYVSIDKRINNKQLLSFTGFAAPMEQGLAAYEQKEADRLAKTNYYNSLWGYQNGKVRNSAVSTTLRPMLQLSHVYSPDKDARLTTSLFYTFGKASQSGLSWYNTLNPHPDYYRYLPGYYYDKGDAVTGDYLSQKWAADVNTRQVNWDRLIALNRANLYVLPSQLGQGIVSDQTRARYSVEDRVESLSNIGINSVYNKRIGKLFLSAGLNAGIYQNRKYKVMNDLLGATYWLDYDQFVQSLGVDPTYQQNDLAHPDKKIYKGDKFGYDYSLHINHAELWSQVESSFKSLDVYGGLSLSHSTLWREGFVANGKFPTTSKGLSEKLSLFNYGIKGGLTYKITGRHFITANASVISRPPTADNVFVSPAVQNDVVNGIGNETILSGDVSYLIKYTSLKLRFTYYNTQFNNQVRIRSYWNDAYNTNVDLVMKHVNQNNQGIELGIEKTLLTAQQVQAAFGLGQFVYTNRPTLDAWQDNNNAALYKDRSSFLKNYKAGSSPQLVVGLGYKYTAKKHWFAGICFNYLDEIYVEPNPDRRTQEAISKYVSNEYGSYSAITKQERLPGYVLVNMNGGASYRINKKYILNLNLSINNVLNSTKNRAAGYEQLRWSATNINRFANKYMYLPGATYMAMINFNF